MLDWVKPLAPNEFTPHSSEVENALESAVPNVEKWAIGVLSALPDADFDRERAAQIASEALWRENAGLAKDAAKFLSLLALNTSDVAGVAWDALNDATALENVGLCEVIYRALVKIKSKRKELELSDAAREKLGLLSAAQSERFGKFAGKLAFYSASEKRCPQRSGASANWLSPILSLLLLSRSLTLRFAKTTERQCFSDWL